MGSSKKQTVGYRYFMGLHFGLCHGPVDALLEIRGGGRKAWDGSAQLVRATIKGPLGLELDIPVGYEPATGPVTESRRIRILAPELWGGEKKEGGIFGHMDVMMGEPDQAPNDYLISQLGTPMPAFRGMLSLVFKGMVGAMNPYPKPWAFKVRRLHKGWHGGAAWYDAKAAVDLADRTPLALYVALDLSGSMATMTDNGQTRIANAKTALNGALGYLQAAVGAGVRADVMVVGWGNYPDTRQSILRRNCTAADIADIIAWVNGRTTGLRTYFPAGVQDLASFLADAPADARAVGMFITDGEPSDPSASESATQMAAIARQRIDAAGTISMRAVNIDLPDTQFTDVVDNTGLGAAVVAGGNPDELQGIIRAALGIGLQGMNPAHIIYQGMTDPDWGMGYPAATLDPVSFQAAADTFHAERLGLCGMWTQQDSIEGFLQNVANHAGVVITQDRRSGLFKLIPVRGGYNVAELPEFRRGLNVRAVESFERAGLGETVNEVVAQFNDATTGKRGSVTVQHLANIQAQGGVVSQTVNYPLAPTATIAQRLAMLELLARATPLCKAQLLVDRSGSGILEGEVVRWSDAKLGIVDMPMRVLNVGEGSPTDGTIRLDLVEDVFGLPATTYVGQQPSGWEEPSPEPQPSPAAAALELPYVAIHRAEGASVANAVAPGSGFLGMAAAKPSGLSYGFALYTRPAGVGEFEETGAGEWTPTALLAAAAGPTDAVLQVAAVSDSSAFVPGALVQVGSGPQAELVRVDSTGAGTLSVGRGVGDTVPNREGWPAGTRLWVLEDDLAASSVEYVQGETVEAKAATNASAGTLPLASAPGDSVTMAARVARPYPPACVEVNGIAYPDPNDSLDAEVTVSWRHRDRLLQADQLLDQAAASVGPEPGTTYTVEYYTEDGTTPVDVETGIAGASSTPWPAPGEGRYRIEVFSQRGGLESWQRQTRVVLVGAELWTPARMANVPKVWVDWDSDLTETGGGASSISNRGTIGGSYTQGTSGRRPTIVPNELGGKRIMRFDGGDVLAAPSAGLGVMRNVSAGWMMAVAKKTVSDAAATSRRVFVFTTPAAAARFGLYWDDASAANRIVLGARRTDAGTYHRVQSTAPSVSAWRIMAASVDYSARTMRLHVDGVLQGELTGAFDAAGTTSDTNSVDAGIGANDAATVGFVGDMALVIAGSGAVPSTAERQRLEGWAAWQLGLQANLPAAHPFHTVAPYVLTPALQPSFGALPAVFGFVAATGTGGIGAAAGPAAGAAFGQLLEPSPTLAAGQGLKVTSDAGAVTVRLDGITLPAGGARARVLDHKGNSVALVDLADGGGYWSGSDDGALVAGAVYYVRVSAV